MQRANLQRLAIDLLESNTGQIKKVPENPRTYTNEQMEAMIKSLKDLPEMLEARPLIVYPQDGKYIVVGGNRRFDAARHLNYEELPCYVLAEDTPAEKIRAYTIKDNLSYGDWDYGKLLEGWDIPELEDFGFDTSVLDDFTATVETSLDEVEEDEDFTEEVEPICKPGDVWVLGEHRLVCGDATVATDYDKLMQGESAFMMVTDPPYNVDYTGGTKDKLKIQNDNMGSAEFVQFLTDTFGLAMASILPGGAFYIWHATCTTYEFVTAARNAGMTVRQTLIWAKNSLVLSRQDYQWRHEPCLYGWKDGAAHYFTDSRKETTVIEEDRPTKNDLHPTMKPVKLFARLINNSSHTGDIVLDPFGGSGTTIIACEQLERKARVLELDPHYCDVIINRWEQFSGKKAERITEESQAN